MEIAFSPDMNNAKIEVGSTVTNTKPVGSWAGRGRNQRLVILAPAYSMTGTVESIEKMGGLGTVCMVRTDKGLKAWNISKLETV